jgi:hypothetical protein
MARLEFPDSPGLNSVYVGDNGVTYTWNGTYWSANDGAALDARYVQVAGDTMTGNLTVPSMNTGALAGLRNQLINGNFNNFQRGTSATVSASFGYYTADRWYVGGTNGSTNAIAPTGVSGANFPFVWQDTLSAAGQYRQRIEIFRNGQNAPFGPNSVWTLSFWSTQPVGEISVRFARFIDTANSTAGTNVTSTALTAIDTQSTWTRYSSKLTIDQNASGTDNCFEISIGFTGASNLTGVQLEPGPVATPFEQIPIGLELSLCQRYFQTYAGNIIATIYTTNDTFIVQKLFPVRMRVAPTFNVENTVNWATIETSTRADSFSSTGTATAPNSAVYLVNPQFDAEL